jgi:hypothetical protein
LNAKDAKDAKDAEKGRLSRAKSCVRILCLLRI